MSTGFAGGQGTDREPGMPGMRKEGKSKSGAPWFAGVVCQDGGSGGSGRTCHFEFVH